MALRQESISGRHCVVVRLLLRRLLAAALYALPILGVCAYFTPLYCELTHTLQPTIINDLGYAAAEAQLLTVPPYFVATVLTFLTAYGSYYINRRAVFIIAGAILAIIGYIILITSATTGVQYFATFLCAGGIYPATAITLSWPANNVSGQLKRAVACALQISVGNVRGSTVNIVYAGHLRAHTLFPRASEQSSGRSFTATGHASISGTGSPSDISAWPLLRPR